jgi:hypothetical protein
MAKQFIKFDGVTHEVTSKAVLDAARIKWGDACSEMPLWHTALCEGPGDDAIATLDVSEWNADIAVEYRRMTKAGKPRNVGVNYAGF